MRRTWAVWAAGGVRAVEVFGDTITVVLDSKGIKKVVAEIPSFTEKDKDMPQVVYSRGAKKGSMHIEVHSGRSNPSTQQAQEQQEKKPLELSPINNIDNIDNEKKINTANNMNENENTKDKKVNTKKEHKVPQRRECTVVEVSRALTQDEQKKIEKEITEIGGIVDLFLTHTMNGVVICGAGIEPTINTIKNMSKANVIREEQNKKYHISYMQKNVPDNFYLSLSLQKRVFGNTTLDKYFARYIRNGYLLRKSIWFKWYRDRYMFAAGKNTGRDVEIHVLDTSFGKVHTEVQGRVEIINSMQKMKNSNTNSMKHSMAVASAAAGSSTGLAKNAKVLVYPVFEGATADLADILRGLEEIAKNISQKSVIVLPFSGDASDILDNALSYFSTRSISVVVAAGNETDSACRYSPGRSKYAITVGSISDSFRPSAWSNTGSCVDAYYPGKVTVGEVMGHAGKEEYRYVEREGTSMSAAATAGYIAQLIEQRVYTPEQIKKHFLSFRQKIVPVPQEPSIFPVIASTHTYNSILIDILYLIFTLVLILLPFLFLLKKKSKALIRYRKK